MDEQLHARIFGAVQGVGFRWTVQAHARRLHLCGTVRNCSDGSVEVYASGERPVLEEFLQLLQESPGNASLTGIETTFSAKVQHFDGFRIVF